MPKFDQRSQKNIIHIYRMRFAVVRFFDKLSSAIPSTTFEIEPRA